MRKTRSLLLALALGALGACEDRGDQPGERMGAQEFPDENRETDLEPFDDVHYGDDRVEAETEVPQGEETAPPGAPQGLVPGAGGFEDTRPERLEGERAP